LRWVKIRQGVRQRCPLSPTLFNCFIDELSKELQAAGVGVEVGERLVHSLLYADDVVLMAESPEDLQVLIDVVDSFCRKWRMDINLKKSEAMVANENPAGAPDYAWYCRGKKLKVVLQYKYLGIWFNWNLDWNFHIDYMVGKAKKRTASMLKLLANSRIAVKAKLLVWLSYVRPLLDYGCEVWDANSSQMKRIESVQHKAGVLAFKVNEHTSRHAVRALMGCTSLERRHLGYKLRYLLKLLSMEEKRLTRYVITLGTSKKIRKGPGNKHWISVVQSIIKDDDSLEVGYEKLLEAAGRNGGTVPTEPEWLDESCVLHHRKEWENRIESWIHKGEIEEVKQKSQEPRSTLLLIAKTMEGWTGSLSTR
jgi:hypothetical protein